MAEGIRKDSVKREKSVLDDNGMYSRKYFCTLKQKTIFTEEYRYYHNMFTRANNPKYGEVFKSYDGVYLTDEWRDFQEFANWCQTQVGFGNQGWVLDKDILNTLNKEYGPTKCVFIPPIINSFIAIKNTNRELPLGVSWCESEGKYKAYCAMINGKNKTLGRFNNPEEAFSSYKEAKEQLAIVLSNTYKGKVDSRVIDKLNSFSVDQFIRDRNTILARGEIT